MDRERIVSWLFNDGDGSLWSCKLTGAEHDVLHACMRPCARLWVLGIDCEGLAQVGKPCDKVKEEG